MKLPQYKNIKWNYLGLSFAIPVTLILLLMLVAGYTPFGNSRSMLYSDMYHQYFPFFKAFRQALLSGDSLLYSWDVGMGMDYLGLMAYYLASPLNLLSVLVPESFLLQYFSLLMPIKLGLASLFFAIFLKKLYGKDDLSITLFGIFYGTCAWAIGYHWNIMWLDTFALLPLVVLGTIALLRDKKFVLYTVSLFFAVITNYYIGFFVCIFVLFVFICYQICRWKGIIRFVWDFIRIGVFTVFALGMTAILELPALAALQTTQSSVNSFPEYFYLNMVDHQLTAEARNAWIAYKNAKEAGADTHDLWRTALKASIDPILMGMEQAAGNMGGGLEPTFKEGLPNLYCGVGTIFFSFLFLTTKQIKLRDKICAVFLLAFFLISFTVRQLDYIWHGFHFPNMIPYRFSFLFSFVMVYMAYRAYLFRHRLKIWQIILSGVLAMVIINCYKGEDDPVFWTYNLVFFILYFGIILYERYDGKIPLLHTKGKLRQICRSRVQRRVIANAILPAIMILELIMNIVNFGVNFPYTGISNYPNGTEHAASIIRYMHEREKDTLFYRAEVTHSQTLNDGALNNYNGISTFTSSANVRVTEFMQALGYGAKNTYNRYCWEESSPVANLFLNLKYMIERDGRIKENPYFDEIHHYGKVYLLENNAYLPLGFLAEESLADLEFTANSNNFLFQNRLFQAATGLEEDVWTMTPSAWLTIEGNGTGIASQSSSGYVSYSNDNVQTYLTFTYNIQESGFLCLDLDMSARNNFYVSKNDFEVVSESISLPQTLSVCQVQPGDVIKMTITCKANESGSINVKAALVNDAVFRAGYDILSASTLELTEFSNTYAAGTIHCNRDGLLYTSIPQNGENWSVTVDGKPAEIKLVGDAMIAVSLTEGDHTVEFTYHNEAFSIGWRVSLGCALTFGCLVILVYLLPRLSVKGKYEKAITDSASQPESTDEEINQQEPPAEIE